jgi:hypothetical protein
MVLPRSGELRAERSEDSIRDLDQGHVAIVRAQVRVLSAGLAQKGVELAGQLGSREVAAHHDEMAEGATALGVRGRVRRLEQGDRAIAKRHGVSQSLDLVAMLPQARDVGDTRHAAERQHQVVVCEDFLDVGLDRPAGHLAALQVEALDFRHPERGRAQEGANRDHGIPRMEAPGARLDEERWNTK